MNALPILYSFRRCPYAMRARMAIWASGSAVSLREVVLRNKPAALCRGLAQGHGTGAGLSQWFGDRRKYCHYGLGP